LAYRKEHNQLLTLLYKASEESYETLYLK